MCVKTTTLDDIPLPFAVPTSPCCAPPDQAPAATVPPWTFPILVRTVDLSERELTIDRASILYAFRGVHARNRVIEAPFSGSPDLCDHAIYLRTANGLYRALGGSGSLDDIFARLPPVFAHVVERRVIVNLAAKFEWDAPRGAHVRRIGYELRTSPRGTSVEWITISRRCLPGVLARLA